MCECPICMEVIEENKNVVITNCMHKFHAECLFKNIYTNGYKCPNCRGALIPVVERKPTWFIDRIGDIITASVEVIPQSQMQHYDISSNIVIDTSSGMYSDTDDDSD
jgi:hypothetical protein